MKKAIRSFVLFALALQLAFGSLPFTSAQRNQPLESDNPQTAPVGGVDGMPGWPIPDQPIPQHEPGQPSRSESYSTTVIRPNALGVNEAVTLTGVDAMAANGLDPLAGSYRLVGKDSVAFGIYDYTNHNINLSTYQNDSIDLAAGSSIQLAPPGATQHQSLQMTTGDLNGDGVDEQIVAWIDSSSQHIYLAIGEMPGTNGRFSSEPAAVAAGDQIDLLARGYDQALWHAHFDGTSWSDWDNNGGGLLLSAPTVASTGGVSFTVFAVGTDNQLYQRHWNGSAWVGSSWTGLPVDADFSTVPTWLGAPPELEAPAVMARGTNEMDVFRVAPDRTLHWIHFNGSAWGSWQSLGGMLASGPGIVKLEADGRLQVFAIGADQALWYLLSSGTGWEMSGFTYHWQRVKSEGIDPGVILVSAPAAVEATGGEIRVYVRGSDDPIHITDDALWQASYTSANGWSWTKGGTGVASRPAVVWGSAGLSLYAQAANRSLQTSSDGDIWSPFGIPWLPVCCLSTPIDTGIVNYVTTITDPPVSQQYLLDVETGHFLGDGREQIVLAARDLRYTSPENDPYTTLSLHLLDVQDGFRTVIERGKFDGTESQYVNTYFPRLAVGEFNYDGSDEIALAYGTRAGGVRVYLDIDYSENNSKLAWLKDGTYHLPNYRYADNSISSIQVAAGWRACLFVNDESNSPSKCFTADDPNLHDDVYDSTTIGVGDSVSRVEITNVGSSVIPPASRHGNGTIRLDGIFDQRNAYVGLEIFDVSPQDSTLTRQAREYYEINHSEWIHAAPDNTLGIVAGDFDGAKNSDGMLNDEIALMYSRAWFRGAPDGLDSYEQFFHILNIEPETPGLPALIISDHRTRESEYFGLPGWDAYWPYSARIVLTTGDFDGDGRKEIARTWASGFMNGNWPDLVRDLEVLDWSSGTWATTSLHFPINDFESYKDFLVAGDINSDLRDEILFYNSSEGTLKAYTFMPGSAPMAIPGSTETISFGNNVPVLTTGDFRGEGIRVGPPTYRLQEKMTTPLAFINLPPMHRDIINVEGVDTVVEMLNEASAIYDSSIANGVISTFESKREWELSTGFEMSVGGGGAKVTTSLDNTYGQNFSNSITNISGIEVDDTTTANLFDQVLYNSTDYAIWEYPVLGLTDGDGTKAQTITVVWPKVKEANMTNDPTTEKGNLCNVNFYAPGHQIYNVWSYDDKALGSAGFSDLGQYITSKPTGSGTKFTLRFSQNSQASRSENFHNQISTGLELSYESSLDIPIIGKAWDFSFRAYADGKYGSSTLSTFTSSVSQETGVTVNYPASTSAPGVEIYLYWAKAGYLVVDYQTTPNALTEPWSHYTRPDPAFLLPWYGFPDPENPVAPPCGGDLQLFTHDIKIDPSYVQIGETTTITATVRNLSDEPLGNVNVKFYLGEPSGGNNIGQCSVYDLNRNLGPKQCSIDWAVTGGSGEEKVYAVIDPGYTVNEMHDEGDVIDNNVGYGLLYVANADYLDPGSSQIQTYQSILTEAAPGLGYGLYLPVGNDVKTIRFELVPVEIPGLAIVGSPIQVQAYPGGQQEETPNLAFHPTPAGLVAFYRDSDLRSGSNETALNLYRLDGTNWVLATCPGAQAIRFPEDNRLATPICQTGTYVLSEGPPELIVYLPLIWR